MASVPFKVKAIYEYTSGHEDDLPFGIGQVITVTDDDDADWYGGEYVDDSGVKQEGIFPRNFVEKFEPTAPPRPTRTRKKEAEPATETPPPPPPVAPAELSPVEEPIATREEEVEEAPASSAPLPAEPRSPQVPSVPVAKPPDAAPVPAPVPVEPVAPEPVSTPSTTQPPPKAPAQARQPPVAAEKPVSNSFKDRIAAFNKPAAPPVAPFKPSNLSSGSSGFIKKPFVAPPPSRNAYVPPPREAPTSKVYRREEDPEIKEKEAESQENAERAGLAPTAAPEGQGDDQPKPTSLKERIALLQKQQAEAAQRHADAAAKKEKPKRPPPKKRTESELQQETTTEESDVAPTLERRDTSEFTGKKSMDEPRSTRQSLSIRRKSSAGPASVPVPVENDGNEADMSGAGDTTEGQEDLTEREDSDEKTRVPSQGTLKVEPREDEEEDEDQEEGDDEVDPEVRRKEELRARMAKMSGGMGFHGMFGGGMPMGGPAPGKKPKGMPTIERRSSEMTDGPSSPRMTAPPVPTMMALPGMGKQREEEEAAPEPPSRDELIGEEITPVASGHLTGADVETPRGPPPVPGGRPAPPPVPTESRPPPPPPPAGVKSPSVGSESDDELSENPQRAVETPRAEAPPTARAPPPIPLASPGVPTSPKLGGRQTSYMGEISPTSPPAPPQPSKRNSRPPPPIPNAAPPPPTQNRPPPPPPPGGALSRASTADERTASPMKPGALDNGEEEVSDYEGDYDTDIASSVPHKDALKAHARDSSFDDSIHVRSPVTEAPPSMPPPPPIPGTSAPRSGPPPVPSQPAPSARQSVDAPRAAPPPPPPPKESSYSYNDDDYDPYNYNAMQSPPISASRSMSRHEEPASITETAPSYQSPPPPPPDRRGPPPAPMAAPPPARAPPRQSLDVQRPTGTRKSMEAPRPSMETGYMANDVDLATHTQWWLSRNGLPPIFQNKRDIYCEFDESSSTADGRPVISKEVFILFPDYSQTVISVQFDPQNGSDVELEQRHEPPPRALRQDQLEEAYEQFGRQIAASVAGKKDSVIGDGSPHALVFELLRPFKDVLHPVGTRAFGALVYANLANASTQLNDEIRPGDIISIRNAKFQGKHGAMHAKYSVEVGKPDHVAVVAEWDGTKKKVRAWEQGRESKKIKQESFKLEDLRSGEVKIWRVMPRSWIGWSSHD
ncbi:hypothetical protein F4778DRAFT_757368 [Xylariomycetidae sp. FL2044]|nr:hypothetical protein F4778DRAFT_757368 [Xylariomycetidae sp. FL2044]